MLWPSSSTSPRARRDEAGDHPQGRRLAAAGRPEQHDQLALGDLQAHLVDGQMRAVAFRQPVERRAGSYGHARQPDLPVEQEQRGADQHHLRHRDRRDQRVDVILQSIAARRSAASSGPARSGTSVISRFSNETMNANSAPATMPPRIAGKRHAPDHRQRPRAEARRRLLRGPVVVGQRREAQPHHPGQRDQHMRGDHQQIACR